VQTRKTGNGRKPLEPLEAPASVRPFPVAYVYRVEVTTERVAGPAPRLADSAGGRYIQEVLPMIPPSTPEYSFSQAELARLSHYRAAVQAGFYSDGAEALSSAARIVPTASRRTLFTGLSWGGVQVRP